jgi:hypothetical protein
MPLALPINSGLMVNLQYVLHAAMVITVQQPVFNGKYYG